MSPGGRGRGGVTGACQLSNVKGNLLLKEGRDGGDALGLVAAAGKDKVLQLGRANGGVGVDGKVVEGGIEGEVADGNGAGLARIPLLVQLHGDRIGRVEAQRLCKGNVARGQTVGARRPEPVAG